MKKLKFTPKEGIQASKHRKENHFLYSYKLVAVYKGGLVEIADLRIYGTNAMNYACFWFLGNRGTEKHQKTARASGSGSAGGYGYHRPSAAADEAFRSAGLSLGVDISGRGDSALESALLSLGAFLGYKKCHVLKAHA
jgi:hypothetical protein